MIASSLKEEKQQQDGSDEIVDLLLNKGADVNIKSEYSQPPFCLCCVGVGGRERERGLALCE